LDEVEKICLIDYDKVEQRNLINSIYTNEHLGRDKVEALEGIIRRDNKNISIIKLNTKYIEGQTILPEKFDLVLDCRDFTYDRTNEISARFYISSRYLIVDCRKDVVYEQHIEGKYTSFLNKNDLKYAAFEASMLIHKQAINLLIENQSVVSIELDYLDKRIKEDLSQQKELEVIKKVDNNRKRFVNLEDVCNKIIEFNKQNDITICLGNIEESNIDSTIPRTTLKTNEDVLAALSSLVNLPYTYPTYIIRPQKVNNYFYIELLPDTGAA
jgi:hypothetical protein